MGDEGGAGGLVKGIKKTLNAHMWNGRWQREGDILAGWLLSIIRAEPHVCPYCRAAVSRALDRALQDGPTVEQMEPLVEEDSDENRAAQ